MKDCPEAERLFDELKRADYGEPGAMDLYLAQIAEEQKQYDKAIERYRAVPDGDRAWLAKLRIGAMYGKQGKLAQAQRWSRGPGRGHDRAADPGPAGGGAAAARCRRRCRRVRGAREGARRTSRPARPALRPRDGRREARQARRRRGAAEAADRDQARRRAGAERAGLHAGRPHAAHERGLRADRARAQALARRSVHSRQHGLGALPPGQSRRRRDATCERALDERPDPEIAAHLGEVLWAQGRPRSRARGLAVAARRRTPTTRCCWRRSGGSSRTPMRGAASVAAFAHGCGACSRGCAALPPAPTAPVRARAWPISPFAVDGRLSARHGERRRGGAFTWVHATRARFDRSCDAARTDARRDRRECRSACALRLPTARRTVRPTGER